MSRSRIQELAMKIVDADETYPDRSPAEEGVRLDPDTEVLPALRPEVLADAAQRQTKAMVHAALFKSTGEAPTIGPYQVLKRLGEGGMGVVYAAYDEKLERKVALKLIRGAVMRGPEGRARTLREARALARLSHPNVVHVYQVGEVDDEIFVAMEFLTGPTLRAWLESQPRGWREVLAVFRQAGEGLAAAHRQGVVHRDFKPANVIVGDDGRVRVLDFGLAHFGDEDELRRALPAAREVTDVLLTQTGAVLGTPAYMAAEQFSGARGDAKTDQFSFCTALYEALYRQRPFAGDKLDALMAAVTEGRVASVKSSGRDVPGWLHRVVVRGLQPDPAARWPSMDALLAALDPPQARTRWRRVVAVAASTLALLIGGMGYIFALESPGDRRPRDGHEAAEQAQAEAQRARDEKSLLAASAAVTRDPVETIRALAQLGGDDPATWEKARFFAAAAEAQGLPERVLRAERPLAEVRPLAGGGLVGRDELGAVWRWEMSEGTGVEVLPPGAATQLLTARDAPVWAVVDGKSVRVFGADEVQTIVLDPEASHYYNWNLAADGRALTATASLVKRGSPAEVALKWWDLSRPRAPSQAIALQPVNFPAISADASMVIATAERGIRVILPREGSEERLAYAGRPFALSGDHRFVVAHPNGDDDGVIDVVDVTTGKSRRVTADWAVMVGEADVLFTRPEYGHVALWRESLATGETVWRMPLPTHSRRVDERLVVDAAGEQFAAAVGDGWGVGDLQRGGWRSFLTVPKDRSPQWAEAGAIVVMHRDEVRVHRPTTSPVQIHARGRGCGLAPAGRWAVMTPWDPRRAGFTRIALASRAQETFRCPDLPPPARADQYEAHPVSPFVDDEGQVVVLGNDGWSCWWDEQHGARLGAQPLPGWIVALPRGVARIDGAEVEAWAGPEARTQRWTAAAMVADLQASPNGALLAVRSEKGVELLGVETGAVTPLVTEATPLARAEVTAGALAWSRDSRQLAVLKPLAGSMELTLWDVSDQPRAIHQHVLKDSPGRPVNRVAFTPAGTSVALTDRHKSLMLLGLENGATRQIEAPELDGLVMRSESEAFGLDRQGAAFLIGIGAGELTPLAPNPDLGASTNPPIRRAEDGTVWACNALGMGTLLSVAGAGESSLEAWQAALRERAASL